MLPAQARSGTWPELVDDIDILVDAAARDRRSKEEFIQQLRALMDKYYGE